MPLEDWRDVLDRLPPKQREAFVRGYRRGEREVDEEYRRKVDPFGLGALRVLIDGLPKRCNGLSEPARVVAAERLRDASDLIERGEVN